MHRYQKNKTENIENRKKFFSRNLFFKYYLCLGFDDIIWKTLTRSRRSLFGKSMNQFFRSKKTQMLQLNTSQFLENKKTIIRVGQVHSQYYDKKGKKIEKKKKLSKNKNLSISDFFFWQKSHFWNSFIPEQNQWQCIPYVANLESDNYERF